MTRCDVAGCPNNAAVRVAYGEPVREADLCAPHAQLQWDRMKAGVSLGITPSPTYGSPGEPVFTTDKR